jgi:hypothetical protein
MRAIWKAFQNLLWNLAFWLLSLLCETPFTLVLGFLTECWVEDDIPALFNGRALNMVLLIGGMSLGCRFFSLHLFGSWILKRVLFEKGVGPLGMGLADFVLANLWITVWALVQPDGLAALLFHDPHGQLWLVSIPPIGLGSILFRAFFGKWILTRPRLQEAFGIPPKAKLVPGGA